jgi:translation initiation factor IF-3
MPAAQQAPAREGPRINDEIRVPQVRLIDDAGEMIGVMSAREALIRAYDLGLDLVEISPNAVPPVCKILDYGKYKYEQQKKANEARKKQKVVEIKEIKVRPNIDDHDYDVKMKQMKNFIGEGDKVKVTLRFRGREMAHQELGVKVLERIRSDLTELVKVEQMPKLENRTKPCLKAPSPDWKLPPPVTRQRRWTYCWQPCGALPPAPALKNLRRQNRRSRLSFWRPALPPRLRAS